MCVKSKIIGKADFFAIGKQKQKNSLILIRFPSALSGLFLFEWLYEEGITFLKIGQKKTKEEVSKRNNTVKVFKIDLAFCTVI